MRWGSRYGPEYVARLFEGVSRHLSRPHQFVCLTDDPASVPEGALAYPLPEFDLPDGEQDLVWRKLSLFQSPLFDLSGQALFLDLDVVIVDSLDPLFDTPGSFYIIRDDDLGLPKIGRWLNPRRAQRLRDIGNSSVVRFKINALNFIPKKYQSDPQAAMDSTPCRREQDFLSEQMKAIGELRFWPKGWCVSYKTHCVPPLISLFRVPMIPPNAKIIVFAGKLKIPDAIAGRGGSWYRRTRPAAWLAKAWSSKTPAPNVE